MTAFLPQDLGTWMVSVLLAVAAHGVTFFRSRSVTLGLLSSLAALVVGAVIGVFWPTGVGLLVGGLLFIYGIVGGVGFFCLGAWREIRHLSEDPGDDW